MPPTQTPGKKRTPKAYKSKAAPDKSRKPKRSKIVKKQLDLPSNQSKAESSPYESLQASTKQGSMDFESLARGITHIHERLQSQAIKAVNASLTMYDF